MDEHIRRCAQRHWVALDAMLSRTLPPVDVDRCRAALRGNVDELSETYARRLAEGTGGAFPSQELLEIGKLTAASLAAAWRSDRDTGPD